MAGAEQDLTPIDCSICKDTLDDPRALPCGHCYCGPPKDCLRGVQKESGLICAFCKEKFNLQISQLKPLYGIREYIKQTVSVKKGGSLQVMCKHHVNSAVMFWCEECEEKSCTECFAHMHQSHELITFTNYLKQKVYPVYKRTFDRVRFLQNEATDLTQKLEEINADNYQKQLLNSYSEELSNIEDEWKSVGKFTANPQAEVDLNVIESFVSQSFEELDSIETRLKEIKIFNLATFRYSTQITSFMPTENECQFKIGSIKVPYKDKLDISFIIKFRRNPDAIILVESHIKYKPLHVADINSILGNIEISLPFSAYNMKYIIENKDFPGQWKGEYRFDGLPVFTLGESFQLLLGCDFVFREIAR